MGGKKECTTTQFFKYIFLFCFLTWPLKNEQLQAIWAQKYFISQVSYSALILFGFSVDTSGVSTFSLPFYLHVRVSWQPSLVLSRSLPLSPLPLKVNPLALPCFTSSLGTLRSQPPCSATSKLVLSHRLNKTLPTPSSLLSTAFSNSYHNSSPGWKTFCHFFPTKTLDFWPQVRRTSSSAHLVMRIFLNKQR